MSTDVDLLKVAASMQTLEARFIESRSLGLHLSAEDEAEFKRLAVEAKAMLDSELGYLNDFSSNLFHAINSGSGGFLGGPSLASVKGARAIVEGGVNQIRRKVSPRANALRPSITPYVEPSRLAELRAITGKAWDVRRLIRLVEELNLSYANECHMAIAMLVRAIADHVPPVFGCKTFNEVANNYPGAKSFRGSMQHLNLSLRNVADAHLHVQIRPSEVIPTSAQVDFRADLDVLLGEVVRVLK
jgi:hypothetical protein